MVLYMDSTAQSAAGGPIGVIAENGEEIIFAGTTVYSMESRENNQVYRRYARDSDVSFIFDGAAPAVDFYAVPRLDIFAFDSRGGYFATFGEVTGMDSDAPIYYVDKDRQCFSVASSLRVFINRLNAGLSWQDEKKEAPGVVLYPSRESAKQALNFVALPEDWPQAP